MADTKWVVANDTTKVYRYASDSSGNLNSDKFVKVLSKGEIIAGEETIEGKWVKYSEDGVNGYIQRSNLIEFTTSSTNSDYGETDAVSYEDLYKFFSGDQTEDDQVLLEAFKSSNRAIFGLPYQFSSIVDSRIEGTGIGRKYGEKILSRAPLLFLSPGRPKIVKNDASQKGIIQALLDKAAGKDSVDVESFLGTTTYYTLESAYTEFFRHVNFACAAVAEFMGIGDRKIKLYGRERKISTIRWQDVMDKQFCKTFLKASQQIPFYVEGLSSVSENLSNDTRESSLVSTLNGVSDSAREIQYLLGSATNSDLIQKYADSGFVDSSAIIDKLTPKSGFMKTIRTGLTNVIAGGKIRFPEIWSGSDFSRSYDVTIKLRSPDADPVSLYLNIMVPYLFLFNMAAPQQKGEMGYTSPFLISAYSKVFNVDMGIISSMSVSKGDEMCWNDQGIPTKMDISLTIKDMYNSVPTGVSNSPKAFVQNTALMDYLANLAGVNISSGAVGRKIEIYYILARNNVTQVHLNLGDRLAESLYHTSVGKAFSELMYYGKKIFKS